MNFKFQSKFITFTKFQIRPIWTTLTKYKDDKDYYSILQVSQNATVDEIKEAFHKLAEIYKPEENKNPKIEKTAKIRDITEAYDVLSDNTKRVKYDEALGESKLMKMLRVVNKQIFRPVKIGDVVKVEITHLQSLRGVVKNVSANITVRCRKCEGSGMLYGKYSMLCLACNGTGVQIIPRHNNIPPMKCLICRGQGTTNRQSCDWCNSTGHIMTINTIPLKISPGRNHGDIVKLKYGKSLLIVLLQIKRDSQQHFVREGLNIYSEVEISLSKAILGGLVYVKGIYGGSTVKLEPGLLCGAKLVFPRKGIRKPNTQLFGYHIALLRVKVPTNLTDSQRSLIKDLL